MAYVHRRVVAGRSVEHRKMQSPRFHTKGVKRGPNHGTTSEKQALINERVAEEHLRWDINANFRHMDMHVVLHLIRKDATFEQLLEYKADFLANLRQITRKRGIKGRRTIVVIESKRMTNPHIHVIITKLDPQIIQEAWEDVPKGGGRVSFQYLDRRGNHYKLANYLMKESRSTMQRYRDLGIRGKRYTKSQGMARPKVSYEKVKAASWKEDPRPGKGAKLYMFDDGSTSRSGWHEMTGYPFQEYFEVFNE